MREEIRGDEANRIMIAQHLLGVAQVIPRQGPLSYLRTTWPASKGISQDPPQRRPLIVGIWGIVERCRGGGGFSNSRSCMSGAARLYDLEQPR